MPNGQVIMAKYDGNGSISLWRMNNGAELLESWPLAVAATEPPIVVAASSRLYLISSDAGSIEVFLKIYPAEADANAYLPCSIYHAHASYPVSVDDPIVPVLPKAKLAAFPNPMHNELKLSAELSSGHNHRIDVFNLRGQKVISFSGTAASANGKIEYTWNGCDARGKEVASGIYLLRLYVDDKAAISKRICRY
jgi:hypothetical protein